MRHALLFLALAAPMVIAPFLFLSAADAQGLDPAVDRGWDLAQHRCAECHAVRPGRDSSDGMAPPFTILRLRYNEISLDKRIRAITHGEHGGMPPILLSDAERSDLVAYIESLGPE